MAVNQDFALSVLLADECTWAWYLCSWHTLTHDKCLFGLWHIPKPLSFKGFSFDSAANLSSISVFIRSTDPTCRWRRSAWPSLRVEEARCCCGPGKGWYSHAVCCCHLFLFRYWQSSTFRWATTSPWTHDAIGWAKIEQLADANVYRGIGSRWWCACHHSPKFQSCAGWVRTLK